MGSIGSLTPPTQTGGMSTKGGGGFLGGLAQGLQPPSQVPVWMENLNQQFNRPTQNFQGPMPPIGGVSLRNRLFSFFRGQR